MDGSCTRTIYQFVDRGINLIRPRYEGRQLYSLNRGGLLAIVQQLNLEMSSSVSRLVLFQRVAQALTDSDQFDPHENTLIQSEHFPDIMGLNVWRLERLVTVYHLPRDEPYNNVRNLYIH